MHHTWLALAALCAAVPGVSGAKPRLRRWTDGASPLVADDGRGDGAERRRELRFRRAKAEVVATINSDDAVGRRGRVTSTLYDALHAAQLMRRPPKSWWSDEGGASAPPPPPIDDGDGGVAAASDARGGDAPSSAASVAAAAGIVDANDGELGGGLSVGLGGRAAGSSVVCAPGKRRSALVALLLSIFVGFGSEYLYYGYMWQGLARAVVEALFLSTLVYFAVAMILKNVVKLWEKGMPICADLAASCSCAMCWMLSLLVMSWNVFMWIAIPTFAFVPIDGCHPSDLGGYVPLVGDVLI